VTIQDFISILQAQPFRAFRMRTVRGEFVVSYPLGAALTPQLRIAVVVDDRRVETFGPDDIEGCEVFGKPMSLAEAIGAIDPATLARNAQSLLTAQEVTEPMTRKRKAQSMDRGQVQLVGSYAKSGVRVVHATVVTRDGQLLLSTADTRWSVHGVEQFENGTTLYLHHLDHPTVEQRIMLWPPDKGTFESFAEAMPPSKLAEELRRRDSRLSAKPAKAVKPPADYLRGIVQKWTIAKPDGWRAAFGANSPALDPLRFEFALVPRTLKDGPSIKNPCITDIMKEEILFNLVDTDWDATGEQRESNWHLKLRHPEYAKEKLLLHIDVDRRAATVDDDPTLLPLGWIERHLRNFAQYRGWTRMYDALRRGPVKRNQPDVVMPLAKGFLAELWAGEPRLPLPFLQPHIKDAEGGTVLDLRATSWSAAIQGEEAIPAVTLILASGERKARNGTNRYPLHVNLVTHLVTSPKLKGSTTIGMLQSGVRRVNGVKWMLEEIPEWFAKGRSLPEAPE
jgi:hypothetical protein